MLVLVGSIWQISASSIFWHKKTATLINIANLHLRLALFPFLHLLDAFRNLVNRNFTPVGKNRFLVFDDRPLIWYNLTFSHFFLTETKQYGVQVSVGPWHIWNGPYSFVQLSSGSLRRGFAYSGTCCQLCFHVTLNLWKWPYRFFWCCCLLASSALAPGCCRGYFQKCWRRLWNSQRGFGLHLGSCSCCLPALGVDMTMMEDSSPLPGLLACLALLWWPSVLGNPASQTGSAHSREQAFAKWESSYVRRLEHQNWHQKHIAGCMHQQQRHSCQELLQMGRCWPARRCTTPFWHVPLSILK